MWRGLALAFVITAVGAVAEGVQFRAQDGPQYDFLACKADIAIGGGGAGGGKALHVDTKVVTPFGYRAIGDLGVGSTISHPSGGPCRVIGVYPQGRKQLYRVTLQDGASVECCGDHLWVYSFARALSKWGKSGDRWKVATTAQLINSMSRGRRVLLPTTEPVKFTAASMRSRRPLPPYSLGVLIGDGCMSDVTRVGFTSVDSEIVRRVHAELGEEWTCSGIDYWATGETRKRVCSSLADLGLLGSLSYYKFVPASYKWGTVSDRFAILQGLMDTDGTVHDGKAYFCSTSLRLAEDVRWLVRSLGGRATITEKAPTFTYRDIKKNGHVAYTVYIRMPDNAEVFALARKRDVGGKHQHADLRQRVVSIEPTRVDEALCIKVDKADGLFLVEDFVVTHNTWAILYQPLKHIQNPRFSALILRREYPQITAPGGLWDKAWELYPHCGGKPREGYLDWTFPSGARIKFGHLQRKEDVRAYDGSEIPLIEFDQLESFEWSQFLYMMSRNRSTCGVRPYLRATCNPDPDHPLREFLSWWIDPDTGLAIPERSGVVRYFVNVNDKVTWADTVEELRDQFGPDCMPKSASFIPSSVYDNKILLASDPAYLANLQGLQHVERMRLLGGDWNIRYTAGSYFRREWIKLVDAVPTPTMTVRYWDRAATPAAQATGKSSWTAGVKMARTRDGQFIVIDVVRFQGSPLEVERAIQNTASQDGAGVKVYIEQDPGQAGKAEALYHVRNLAGYDAHVNPVREAKGIRARGLSAQAEAGNVLALRGAWNKDYLAELAGFDGTDKCMADQVDASSGAFAKLVGTREAGAY